MILMGKELGKDKLPFIVAEISCNHEGDIDQAIKLCQAAKDAGADAVKIQAYYAEDMTINHGGTDFRIEKGLWNGNTLFELYRKTQTPYEYVVQLFSLDIPIFASVFSQKGLAILEDLKCPIYKIASFELPDLNLIRRVARTGKTVILSTGMASLEDIDEAYHCCNIKNTAILHCVSAYPTKLDEANLWRIPWLADLYPMATIGFSDHTRGIIAGPLACAMGARIVEKHIALDGTNPADSAFSLHPDEFKTYVQNCRIAATASFKVEVQAEADSKQFRRSLYAIKDIQEGQAFTPDNIRSIRPSYGLAPKMYTRLIAGMRATHDIKAGTALTKDMII